MIDQDAFGVVAAELIDHRVIGVGELLVSPDIQIELHVEGRIQPLAQVRRQERNQGVVVVIDAPGDPEDLERWRPPAGRVDPGRSAREQKPSDNNGGRRHFHRFAW
jgi:hypothetical protein